MKRIFAHIIISLVVAITMLGCGTERDNYVVGISLSGDDHWCQRLEQELVREAKYYGITNLRFLNVNDDSARQIECVKR